MKAPDFSSFKKARRLLIFSVFMIIEFTDEFIGSSMDAVMPLIRDELSLSYFSIGLLFSIPIIVSSILDPFVSIWGDMGKRNILVLSGGIIFSLALMLRGISINFIMLLVSMILFYPASGAFVNLTQATLIDLDPGKNEINMSKWAFAGSAGMVMGPAAVTGIIMADISWRWIFLLFGVFSGVLVIVRNLCISHISYRKQSFKDIWTDVKKAVRSKKIIKWLFLIQFGDLMVDIFAGFLALYMVDAAGADPVQAAIAVGVWTIIGLAGDFLLIPLLSKIKSLKYLQISSLCTIIIFPAFLLNENILFKFIMLGLLGLLNSGWYSILMAQIYKNLPGRSGTALALYNISCLFGAFLPFLIGICTEFTGIKYSMWLLILGPAALLSGIRKKEILNKS